MSNTTTQPTDTKSLWEQVLVEIELSVSKATFNTWFKDTHICRQESGTIYVGVPNEFVKTWLAEKYHKTILKILRDKSEQIRGVEYEISKEKPKKPVTQQPEVEDSPEQLPFEKTDVDKSSNLNPRYIFDTFVVGSFNELAHAAGQAVISKPGIAYNPLFVYGKTGNGKTHLIQAVGNYFKDNYSQCRVYYVTSEKFAIDYVNSVQNNNVNRFKEKYRKYDVLVMDDVQFLSNKEKTQEELFHLFNTLYDNNKQIIFSSDMHPNHLKNMEDRLKSRFNAGMIVDISPPDFESRMAILKTKSQKRGVSLSEQIIEYLADSISSNIRELEGALNAIAVQSRVKDEELNLSDVKKLIRNNVKSKKSVPMEDVVKIVSDYYNIDMESIYKKTRKRDIVKPRQIIMYILREDYSIAYPTIGEKIGGRDHTTVIHSYEKIKSNLETDSELAQDINQIRSML